jgi:hypothetical protein
MHFFLKDEFWNMILYLGVRGRGYCFIEDIMVLVG